MSKPEEIVDVNIDEMGEKELEAYEQQQSEDVNVSDKQADEPATSERESDEKSGDDAVEGEKENVSDGNDEDEPGASEGEGDPDKSELNHKGEPKKDRIKEMQAEVTRKQQEAAELRKKNAELQERLRKLESEKFTDIPDDELEDLKETDPDAYIQYIKEKEAYESQKEALELEAINNTLTAQRDEIGRFLSETLKIPVDMEKGIDEQPEEVRQFIESGAFDKIDNFLKTNMKESESGIYTTDQIRVAYRGLFHDDLVAKTAKGIRQETVENIDRAAKGGSKLDRLPEGAKGGQKGFKKLEDYTQAEIDAMGESELDQLLKMAE